MQQTIHAKKPKKYTIEKVNIVAWVCLISYIEPSPATKWIAIILCFLALLLIIFLEHILKDWNETLEKLENVTDELEITRQNLTDAHEKNIKLDLLIIELTEKLSMDNNAVNEALEKCDQVLLELKRRSSGK